jgi:pyroglutamyl-peptidase
VSQLPEVLRDTYPPIRIVAQLEPLKAAYHDIAATVPGLINEHSPDVIIHVGLAVQRNHFAIEKGANRDGYHQFPDVARRVFTKLEAKKAWGKSPNRLDTALDIDAVVASWKSNVRKKADVRVSDDVGSYVCGFAYYLSLEMLWKSGKKGNVMFLHVPSLGGDMDMDTGLEVTLSLIKAIAENS